MKRTLYFIWLLLICVATGISHACAQVSSSNNLMPVPSDCKLNGYRFDIYGSLRIAIAGHYDPRLRAEADRFIRRFGERTGIFPENPSNSILISVQRPGKLVLGENESYTLDISSKKILLSAITDIGAIRGLETLLQLLTSDAKGYFFPGISIHDQPRFAWRGLLLDVALHFMPLDEVERTLDGMAAVKMNVLHLHLCNDQGFRVESKTFPRLQQLASDGQFYSQQDIRSIIQYAGQRGIRIVPEFVVPAHTTAILTAFPELASVKRSYTLQRYFGVFDPVMDPTNEKVYSFLDRLFTEMISLFPDKYFHIGGDENTGKDWQHTAHIAAFMKTHHMKTYMDLQTYFNQRLQPIIRGKDRIMMGWDEILQPGVPKDIVIQSWRGKDAFYESLKKGYRAILSNGYYIDLIQPASFHYLNDPIPDTVNLTKNETANVLGGEATMWSELVSPQTVDSRIWPRTAAIAERLWSPAAVKDTDDMYRRLDFISLQLEGLGLRHESYRTDLLRRMAGSRDIQALEILVGLIEPLKIYERNQGDTMYNVFSPLTRLADAAGPDQKEPRFFNKMIAEWLVAPSPALKTAITEKLTIWKYNDTTFQRLLAHSPALQEAAPLSKNLSYLAAAALEAIDYIESRQRPAATWLYTQKNIIEQARQQSGRCELQVVDAIQKLISRSAEL